MQKRGSYFFVLDVFIASAVLVLTLIIIFSSKVNTPAPDQPFLMAENYMNFLTTTEFRDIANPYKLNFTKSGYINDTRITLDKAILTLDYYKRTNGTQNYSSVFIESISRGVIPEQYGFSYKINGTGIYSRGVDTYQDAQIVLTAKRVSYITIVPEETAYGTKYIHGPVVTEVTIWG
ncbi:MAG: hypothetical protein V1743_08350 [Nanoarchaeota archaeon]